MADHHKKELQRRGTDPMHPQWDHRIPQPEYEKPPPPYRPGEGYSINVIPFAGIAPRRGLRFEKDVERLLERAKELGKQVGNKAEIRPGTYMQRFPVPERYADALAAGGDWLEALEAEGCSVEVDKNKFEHDGQPWLLVVLRGHEKCVRASTLQLMACMVPPLKQLNS